PPDLAGQIVEVYPAQSPTPGTGRPLTQVLVLIGYCGNCFTATGKAKRGPSSLERSENCRPPTSGHRAANAFIVRFPPGQRSLPAPARLSLHGDSHPTALPNPETADNRPPQRRGFSLLVSR